ncbi:hypothetical protein NDU88_001409 [Pleurodeles waltl]|uniref:Uncharacterized protein n=1 Tax=Pleurodeles waltl TaxID=8319 RepID=A0AAV7TJ17_PLEWA|nr:hypothetical protein NDU88_001409 [Pleurodeles waltl]
MPTVTAITAETDCLLAALINMGKSDKNHSKLQFDQRKALKAEAEQMAASDPGAEASMQEEEPDLKQILAAMQQSLAKTDSKMDSLFFRMDRMTERLDKNAERLHQMEKGISDMEDDYTMLNSSR